ncbi:MAG: hypothetical protein JW866_01920 [Ignavibacteriales bacterium]|nr:hypothetical protein [Ignavibacteriales bacterium]
MKKLFFPVLSFFISVLIFSQSTPEKTTTDEFGIKLSGFVKTDVIFDTRDVVSIREGHFLLYPSNEDMDINNEDINKKTSLNMLSIQTRLTGNITGPEAFGAKISGMLEGAFFGHSDGDINGFRLRHAYVKLDWTNTSLLIGQFWHPMFITEVFPGVISFNTGVPFQPFSRNPQIRLTQKFDNFYVSLTAASQRDFSSIGPQGTSSIYLRNSSIPILDINLKYKADNFVAGVGGNYKSLMPRIVTTLDYKTDKRINSLSAVVFGKYTSEDFTFKLEGIIGENLTDLTMLGGYGIKSVDAATGIEEYTNIQTLSSWSEIIYGKDLKFALFLGLTKNLGSKDVIVGASYTRGNNIDKVIRVAPRVEYRSGNTQFAGEIEYTSAGYGVVDNKGKVSDTKNIANIRFLLAAYLFF